MTTDLGEQLKLDGMAAASAAGMVGYHDHAGVVRRQIVTLARTGRPFTIEDVRDAVPEDTEKWMEVHYNAPQSEIRSLGVEGVIVHIGYRKATRAKRKAGVIGVWQGKAA